MTKRYSFEHSSLSHVEGDISRPGTRGELRKKSSSKLKRSRSLKVHSDRHGQAERSQENLENDSFRSGSRPPSLDNDNFLSKGSRNSRPPSTDLFEETKISVNLSSGTSNNSFGDLKRANSKVSDTSTSGKRKEDLNSIFTPPDNYHGPPFFYCHNQSLEKKIVKKNQKTILHEPGPSLKKSMGLIGFERSFQKNITDANLSSLFSEGTLNVEASLISNRILIGGREDSQNLEFLQSLGITHILNVSSQLPNSFPEDIIYYKLMIDDDTEFPIGKFFACASNFIERVERCRGRVLVHCISGVSRSVTLVLAHLMMKHNFTLKEAYQRIKRYRPYIVPNPGFKMALAMYEYEATGSTSVGGEDVPEWDFYEWNTVKISIPKKKIQSSLTCSML